MKEFEKGLQNVPIPDLPVEEFRRALRRDLLRELDARRRRRTLWLLRGATASAVGLAGLLALFVLRPGLPAGIHTALFHGSAVAAPVAPAQGAPLDGASDDRAWLEAFYRDEASPVRVKDLEEERLFAVRRFELTSGKRVILFRELGGSFENDSGTVMAAVRNF